MYVTLKDGRKVRIPSDEEDAAITAAALSDPDCPPLTDEEWERIKPHVVSAREFFSPQTYAALTDKSRPTVFQHVSDDEHAKRVQAIRKRGESKSPAPKEQINLSLSPMVLSAFRATGTGWKARIDAVLREAVQQGRI